MKKTNLLKMLFVLSVLPCAGFAETGRTGKPSVSAEQLAAVQSRYIFTFAPDTPAGDVDRMARDAARNVNGRVDQVFTASVKGFSARMNAVAAEQLRARVPKIMTVEQDQIITTLEDTIALSGAAPWGTVRVKGQACGLPYSRVWVIDTGIELSDPDLSIAETSRHFTAIGTSANDENGHGTHVAGTIGARLVGTTARGVAPGVPVVPVRVLDASGSGSNAGVIAGIDWVAKQKDAACAPNSPDAVWCDKPEAWVVNMSLGGGYSATLNNAVAAAAAKGVRFAIAAGNSARDARNFSPASTNHENVFTVAATSLSATGGDGWASFSNFGPSVVDVAAPGVSVSSTYLGAGYAVLNGTSMATPHVAGVLTMAPLLKSNPSTKALKVNGVSYTDKLVLRTSRESYPIIAYQGAAPQSQPAGTPCAYVQPLMPR